MLDLFAPGHSRIEVTQPEWPYSCCSPEFLQTPSCQENSNGSHHSAQLQMLGPFEIKDELIKIARRTTSQSNLAFLNAGRGNPNWVATKPREASSFSASSRSPRANGSWTSRPESAACRRRRGSPRAWTNGSRITPAVPGTASLGAMVHFAVEKFGFKPDAFVHELVDSIIGDNYPVPDRMLVHNEQIVHEYLMWAMCGEPRPAGQV